MQTNRRTDTVSLNVVSGLDLIAMTTKDITDAPGSTMDLNNKTVNADAIKADLVSELYNIHNVTELLMDVTYRPYPNISEIIRDFKNTSETNETELNEGHTGFNLAIIPAVAVLVFVIILCLKCCTWFQRYTRGSNKEDTGYAVIVKDGDDEYDPIDILSESASTACYDTVSSYCSFLKRSGNESTLNSIRALRPTNLKDINSPNKDLWQRLMRRNANGDIENSPDELSVKTKQGKASALRMSSTSSEETTSEILVDSPFFKRNNRFRVSFVTESTGCQVSPTSDKSMIGHIANKNDRIIRPSVKKPTLKSAQSGLEILMYEQEKKARSVVMVDKGTQTNKSFRYSLKKAKRHVSEGDANEKCLFQLRKLPQNCNKEKLMEHSFDAGYQSQQFGETSTERKSNNCKALSLDSIVVHSSMRDIAESNRTESINKHISVKYPLELDHVISINKHNSVKYPLELDVRLRNNNNPKEPQEKSQVEKQRDQTIVGCNIPVYKHNRNLGNELDDEVFEGEKMPDVVCHTNGIIVCDSCGNNQIKRNNGNIHYFHPSRSDGELHTLPNKISPNTNDCNSCVKHGDTFFNQGRITRTDNTIILTHCDNCYQKKLLGNMTKSCSKLPGVIDPAHLSLGSKGPTVCRREKRSSLNSLESSGYAELSSCESIS